MGWPIVKLGDICRIELGKTPSRSNKKFWDEARTGNKIWLSIADLPLSLKPVMRDSKEYISDDGAKLCKVVPTGTLIVSFKLSLGRLAITGCDLYTNEAIAALYIHDDTLINQDYLYWYLTFFDWDAAAGSDIKVKGKTLNKEKLKLIEIKIPPIPEQKHIVAILDEAFANIEQARANTEQNLKNACELFESYLQQVFSQRDKGWIETNLGCIAEFKNGLNFSQSSKGEKLKVVGVKDFKSNFMVPFEQLETIQIDGDLSEAYELKENDIITVRSNGNKRLIGRCLLMGKIDNKTSYSGFTIRIRLSNKNISPKFLAYYLKSSSTHELLINSGEGANISNLNQKILNSLPIAFPHFDQQIQLVDAIEKVEQESQELEKVYANKLILIKELKKSILQKALNGELTK